MRGVSYRETLAADVEEEAVAAAVRIQAVQRGKAGRKEMAGQKAAATKIQAIQRGKKARGGGGGRGCWS
jgi:hypothetical protein